RSAFAIMIAFVVMAEIVGAELILGAFLGGVLASLLSSKEDENLKYKLDAIGFGFFIPLFFVYVGVQFNLKAFLGETGAWVLAPILLISAFGIKSLASLVFRWAFPWRETLASGFLLSARLSLIIAASAIGLRLGSITEATNADIILAAALTATLAPLGFNSMHIDVADSRKRMMLIYGSGDLAFQVARDLKAHGEEICFVETDAQAVERIQKQGFSLQEGQGNLTGCFDALPASEVDAFLALDADDKANLEACHAARRRGIEHVLVFVTDPLLLPEFRKLGVQALTPSVHRSSLLSLMARNESMFELLTSTTDEHDLRELLLTNPDLVGKRLNEVQLPGDLLVLAIRRDDEMIVPHGGTRLAMGDRLTILGDLERMISVQMWLE
ncbi:MAG: monovalent cation:proton antiporter family protein, partial [Anaerolineales bacterium]